MSAFERHYTVAEVSELWALSTDTVRKIFRDRTGVLMVDHKETMKKRGYRSIRIPESLMQKVYFQLQDSR